MKKIIMFFIILSSITLFADTGSFGYGDYKIGDSKTKVKGLLQSRYTRYQIDYDHENSYTACNDIIVSSDTGAYERKITFRFNTNEELYLIIVSIRNPEDKEVKAIIDGIRQKYGEPTLIDYFSLPVWHIENNKYSINFTVSILPESSQEHKYSMFVTWYGDVKVWKNIYNNEM